MSDKSKKVETADVIEKKGPAPKLKESRFGPAEAKRNIWRVAVDAGVSPDALRDPAYWTHVARHLRPLDRIEAVAEDGTWFAELLVTFVSHNEARVATLGAVQLEAVPAEALANDIASVQWKGPVDLWSVIRKDGTPLKTGMASQADAAAFLANLRPKAA